jgi:amino acid transporter
LGEEKRRKSFIRKPRRERQEAPHERPEEMQAGRSKAPAGQRDKDQREESARVVVPRQERGKRAPSGLDIELREVRYGAASRQAYLRIVPKQQRFKSVAPGHIEATRLASRPRGRVARVFAGAREALLGSPLAASQAIHERLTKVKALAVIGSDPLSSSTYATEEALVVLVLAGSAALVYSLPIAAVVAFLLAVVALSYRQTVVAYPSGGGAYQVAGENLGRPFGLVAAASLVVDYIMLVSVSTAAGTAAITSAVPELYDAKVFIGVLIIALLTTANLRGIRESGSIFAAPTYFFVVAMAVVIVVGFIKVIAGDTPGSLLHVGHTPSTEELIATQGIGIWIVLRAFSSGSTALTGVEAIANSVPMFKEPEARNARVTLTAMAAIGVFLFIGITFLSSRYGLVPSEEQTIVSQLGREVLGENVLYYAYQVATALILFLAANTSFSAFPVLSAVLANDKYMPRQFGFRGDRLAYSNGILVLAISAAVLLVVFNADVTRLIPLYAVGVFVPFALSQAGMVRHWWRERTPGWQFSFAINLLGASACAVVAVIIGLTKFAGGAWISLVIMAVLVVMFSLIFRHYNWFAAQIKVDEEVPIGVPTASSVEPGAPKEHVVVPVDGINKISIGAVGMAREVSSLVTALHLTDNPEEAERFRQRWEQVAPDVPMIVIESPYRAFVAPVVAFIEHLEATEPDKQITIVLPSVRERHWWEGLLHNRDIERIRPVLSGHPSVQVIDFPFDVESGQAHDGG